MVVRPHVAAYAWRLAAPDGIEDLYRPNRPLTVGERLYMEPVQLSVSAREVGHIKQRSGVIRVTTHGWRGR